MEWLPDAPAVVLIAFTIAAALFLIEVALPTLGVAGTVSLVLAAWAVAVLGHQRYEWWPLLFVVAAVCIWAVLLTRRRASLTGQVAAAACFGAGSIAYGVLADDVLTVLLGVAGSIALPMGFRPLLGATRRLLELPHQTGMEALVGRTGRVVNWASGEGTVRLDGSLWNARGPGEVAEDTDVIVRSFSGMTLDVALSATIT